jgi:hypothetical protein
MTYGSDKAHQLSHNDDVPKTGAAWKRLCKWGHWPVARTAAIPLASNRYLAASVAAIWDAVVHQLQRGEHQPAPPGLVRFLDCAPCRINIPAACDRNASCK